MLGRSGLGRTTLLLRQLGLLRQQVRVAVLLRQRGARSKEAHVLGQGLQSCHQRRMCLDRGGEYY